MCQSSQRYQVYKVTSQVYQLLKHVVSQLETKTVT